MCESFFAILECRLLDRCRFASLAEPRMACFIEAVRSRAAALRPRLPLAHSPRSSDGGHHRRTLTTKPATLHKKGAASDDRAAVTRY